MRLFDNKFTNNRVFQKVEAEASKNAKWVCHELCRETFMARYVCDQRRQQSTITPEVEKHVSEFVWAPGSEVSPLTLAFLPYPSPLSFLVSKTARTFMES